MRKLLLSLLFLFLITIGIRLPVFANHIPQPTGHINDFAGVLTPDQKTQLEESLSNYQQQTGNEIAVAIVKALNDDPIEDVAVKTFEEWKIGKKGKDNGLLLFIAVDDRKLRIEIGYGLEPYITDGQAGEIIRNTISPRFKQENYYQGIADGLDAIESQLNSDLTAQDTRQYPSAKTIFDSIEIILVLLFILGNILVYFFAYLARSKSFWAGGVIGAVAGSLIGFLFTSSIAAVIGGILFGVFGLLFDYILSRNYSKLKHASLPTDWWHSRGGFYTGGRTWGGSFGGFGGGRSGGGGTSGGW